MKKGYIQGGCYMINVIDAFYDFKEGFKDNLELSTEGKIELWEKIYSNKYPELLNKCKEDYINEGYKWDEIATKMVFNKTKSDFPRIVEAYDNINNIIPQINIKAYELFDIKLDINIVIYAGLCNSAGWVDVYDNKRAILYGVDKIAELDWHTIDKIEPLLAHELCHVIHFNMRDSANIIDNYNTNYEYGIWRIYIEGFAQFYQSKLMDKDIDSRGIEWINKCDENIDELKKLFLQALYDKEKGTNDFFGDWYTVMGISDVGYYLGKEFIKKLTDKYNLEYIATIELETIENELLEFLTY